MSTLPHPFLCGYTNAVLKAATVALSPEPEEPQEERVVEGPGGFFTIVPPPPKDYSIPSRATKEYLINRLNTHPDVSEMVTAVRVAAGEIEPPPEPPPEPEPEPLVIEYDSWLKSELKTVALDLGIPVPSSYTKDKIIEKLQAYGDQEAVLDALDAL